MRSVIACALLLATVVTPAAADERADKLIREVVAKYASLRSMTGTITLTAFKNNKPVIVSGPLRLMKPNKAVVEVKGEWSSAVASDGKQVTRLMSGNRYMTEPAGGEGKGITFGSGLQVPMFFNPSEFFDGLHASRRTYAGKQKLGTEVFDKLVVTNITMRDDIHYTLYITPDKLVKRFEIEVTNVHSRTISEINNVKLNPRITATDLTYKLPKGAQLLKLP